MPAVVCAAALLASSPGLAAAAPAATAAGGRTGAAAAPPAAAAPRLPPARTVDAILADAVTALGGAAALGRHTSLREKMEIELGGMGIKGTAERYAATGDRSLITTSIPNVLQTREGCDGTRIWSEDPTYGLRVLEGVEAEQARIGTTWNLELRMKEVFPKIEARNEAAPDGSGKHFECLILTPKLGPPLTQCFDSVTHLVVLQRGVRSSPQGDIPFVAKLGDWKQVSDVKIPHRTELQAGPLTLTTRVTSIELDVAVEPSLFAVPKVAGKKKEAQKKSKSKPPAAAAPKPAE
jgi:hypothetical protein